MCVGWLIHYILAGGSYILFVKSGSGIELF